MLFDLARASAAACTAGLTFAQGLFGADGTMRRVEHGRGDQVGHVDQAAQAADTEYRLLVRLARSPRPRGLIAHIIACAAIHGLPSPWLRTADAWVLAVVACCSAAAAAVSVAVSTRALHCYPLVDASTEPPP